MGRTLGVLGEKMQQASTIQYGDTVGIMIHDELLGPALAMVRWTTRLHPGEAIKASYFIRLHIAVTHPVDNYQRIKHGWKIL